MVDMRKAINIAEEHPDLTDDELIEHLDYKLRIAEEKRDEAITLMRNATAAIGKIKHSLHVVSGHAMLIAGEVQKLNSFND